MFSCLQILEAFLWFVLITLLNVTLIILTLSVSRLLNLLLRLVAFLLFFNPPSLASISRWITASSSWKRFCLFVCRALSSIMVICMLTAIRLLLFFFSSRRRHTRFDCDWSSDVCSPICLSLGDLNGLFEDRQGRMWAGTRLHGFFQFAAGETRAAPRIVHRYSTPEGLMATWVSQLFEASEIGRASCRERV